MGTLTLEPRLLTLVRAASPEAGSGCPMLDFVDPINRGPWREAHRDRVMPFSSWGSPTCRGHSTLRLHLKVPLVKIEESQVWARRGFNLGACAMGFNILERLGGQTGWLIQRADELFLGFSRGECHTYGGRYGTLWSEALYPPFPHFA